MNGVNSMRSLVVILCMLALQGCGILRNPVDIPADGMRAIRRERVVNITLMGGAQLNPGRNGAPRPLQVCIYLVTDETWLPGSWLDDGKCRGTGGDAHVFAQERRILSAEQAQQVTLNVPSDKDAWLLVDADFGPQTPANAMPLRLRTSSGEFSFHFVVVNGTRVSDGMRMSRPTVAPVQVDRAGVAAP